tara:strand:- start:3659 stop:4090 length:432 start_codon:yes stop_codon:yes gene_type:complete
MTNQKARNGINPRSSWFGKGINFEKDSRENIDTGNLDYSNAVAWLSKIGCMPGFKGSVKQMHQRRGYIHTSQDTTQWAMDELVEAGLAIKTGEVYALTQKGMKLHGEPNNSFEPTFQKRKSTNASARSNKLTHIATGRTAPDK